MSAVEFGEIFVWKTYIVLLAQLLAQGSAHDDTALAGGGLEVSGTALASGRRHI